MPGQPRQLPHFPFSSRVCPMLLRFRVGSGQTEPPSVSLLRARRSLPATLLSACSPLAPALPSHRPCSGDSHHPAHAGLARWCVVVVCACTTRVHVHAHTRLNPIDVYTPYRPRHPPWSSLSPAFSPHTLPSVLNYARGTLHSFLSPGATPAASAEPNEAFSLSLSLLLSLFRRLLFSLPFSDALETRGRSLDCIAG